jgi:ESCRT-I complex subunit VPS37
VFFITLDCRDSSRNKNRWKCSTLQRKGGDKSIHSRSSTTSLSHSEIVWKLIKLIFAIYFSVIELQSNVKYGIKFKSGNNDVTLLIELGPEFPFKTPKLTLDPNLSHKWIENGELLNAPGLISFTINSDLGRVCQAIIREFEKYPAELAGLPSVSAPLQIQSSITELNSLDPTQLLQLLNDDQYLDDFVEELGPIKALNTELDDLIEGTESLARENLEKNSTLSELQTCVESLTVDFINLGTVYRQKNKRYEEKVAEYSPQNIRQLLEIGISNAESDCEETVEAFLEGNQSLNEFLEDFMKVKKLIALRKFKEERLNYQLNQLKL